MNSTFLTNWTSFKHAVVVLGRTLTRHGCPPSLLPWQPAPTLHLYLLNLSVLTSLTVQFNRKSSALAQVSRYFFSYIVLVVLDAVTRSQISCCTDLPLLTLINVHNVVQVLGGLLKVQLTCSEGFPSLIN